MGNDIELIYRLSVNQEASNPVITSLNPSQIFFSILKDRSRSVWQIIGTLLVNPRKPMGTIPRHKALYHKNSGFNSSLMFPKNNISHLFK